MALTLRTAITAGQTTFDVLGSDDLQPGDFKTIDSETVVIRTAKPATLDYGETARYRVSAYRGAGGTRAAAHDAGATLAVYSGGGGGSLTVDNLVDAPAEVTTIVAAGTTFDGDVASLAFPPGWQVGEGGDLSLVGTDPLEQVLTVVPAEGAANEGTVTFAVMLDPALPEAGVKVFVVDGSGWTVATLVPDAAFRVGTANPSGTLLQINQVGTIGFFGVTPVAKPTGVAVTAEAIHAALVSLGLIAP